MRTLVSLSILAILLAACASSEPLPSSQANKIYGQNVYGLVVRVLDGVEADVSRSEACIKRDALCTVMRQQARGLQYASVHLYDSVVLMKVLAPKGQVSNGDIIKLAVPGNPAEIPKFIEIGAKKDARNTATCDWVDGIPLRLQGGVICQGWTYKSIAGRL